MDAYTWTLLAAIAFLLAVMAYYIISTTINPQGKGAQQKTTRILSRFGALHQCKVLAGVPLSGKDGQELEVENLMVGPFGVLLVKTLGACGDYYGRGGEDQWFFQAQNGGKTSIESPETQLDRQAAALQQQLTAAGVTRLTIHKAIYLPGHPRRTKIYAKAGVPVLAAGKLRGHLEDEKFEKQSGLDINRVLEVLQKP